MEKTIYEVLEKIENSGYEAYIVGGYVRDYLMKKTTDDIDIATNAIPKEIIKILEEYHPVPLEYGNVYLEHKNLKFEITTYRKDYNYKDNRKPDKIEYINSLEEDLERRDFTINAICMDKNGKVIDHLNGSKDIKKKIIKTIGDSNNKIEEDALRIMRAIRLATVLNFKLDNDLKLAIRNNKNILKSLSYERKKEELTKIFTSENKKYGVKLIKELDLLGPLDLKNIDNVLFTKDLIGMWACITLPNTYPFSKNEKNYHSKINALLNENIMDNFILYNYGIYICSIVCDLRKLSKRRLTYLYDKLPIKERSEIDISADEICEVLNTKPGSLLKEIYDDLEVLILKKHIKNEKDELKSYIKATYL